MASIVTVGRTTRNRLRLGKTSIATVADGGTQVDLDDGEIVRDMHRWGGRWVIIQDESNSGDQQLVKTVKVALADADAAAGVVSWQNTVESADIIVTGVVLDVTTASTGACTVDIGAAATAISADNLIDGQDVNAAVGVFDSVLEAGVNGAGAVKVADDEFVTASMATGAAADLAGSLYISYVVA